MTEARALINTLVKTTELASSVQITQKQMEMVREEMLRNPWIENGIGHVFSDHVTINGVRVVAW